MPTNAEIDIVSDLAVRNYEQHGYAVVHVFDEKEVKIVETFATEWVCRLLKFSTRGELSVDRLARYHTWWQSDKVDHGNLFRAVNRHATPVGSIRSTLLNKLVWAFLSQISPGRFQVWDEGLGWVGFRLIRPGMGDGYPPSRKEWGPAKDAVSCWIPVIGRSENETLAMLPGSHLEEYEKYLPERTKFCSSEFRMANPPERDSFLRVSLRPGEVIFMHPCLIHTEDVWESDVTRLNLEVRFNPILAL